MPFQYILTNLLVDVPGAQGAVFLDPEGETVEYVTRQATPYELKLEGAYHGIFLRRGARLVGLNGSGELESVTISGSKLQVMSQALRGGYYLVLVMAPGTSLALAWEAVKRISGALNREIP